MDNFELIGQTLGILGFLFFVITFAQKNDVKFKIYMGIACLIMSIHFYFLSSYVGMILSFFSAIRSYFSLYEKFKKFSYIFCLIYLFSGIAFYSEPIDILPTISGVIGTIALFYLSGVKMRMISLFCAFLWLSYNINIGSIGGILNEVFIILVNSRTIYILKKDKVLIN